MHNENSLTSFQKLKDKVFSTPPHDIDELRQRIVQEFRVLREQPAVICQAVRDMQRAIINFVEQNLKERNNLSMHYIRFSIVFMHPWVQHSTQTFKL